MPESWKIAIHYHERTKHDFRRYARSLGYLDWATQPNPFRRFEGAPLVPLRLSERSDSSGRSVGGINATALRSSGPLYDELFIPGSIAAEPVCLESISALFQFSLALSAWKAFQGARWALRINPSSGNLHPTEGYLIVGPAPGLSDCGGVYHYAPKEHALERRTEFSPSIWEKLIEGFPPHTFFVGLSSIHWREAWKYGERAYRYCQHDAGHALAALALSAALSGWRTAPLDQLSDAAVASLLGLDRKQDFGDAEREHPDLLIVVIPAGAPRLPEPGAPRLSGAGDGTRPIPSQSPTLGEGGAPARELPQEVIAQVNSGTWFGTANRLSADHVDWPIIDEVATACEKPALPRSSQLLPNGLGAPPLLGVGDGSGRTSSQSPTLGEGGAPIPPTSPVRSNLSARQIIFQRRSAVAFDGRTSITADQFYLMLDRTLPRFDRAPWCALGPPVCAHLALFVHRVDELAPGLYFFIRDSPQASKLREAMNPKFAWEKPRGCPDSLPLYQLAAGDAREVATSVSCHQDIAGDGAFSLGMIVEFDEPLRRYGGWFYRRLFWETGMIGQMLYLEAEAAGVRGTGIGCFFDDPVHRLLGLSGTAYQSLYHFTIGGHVEDGRLTTLPPYPLQA